MHPNKHACTHERTHRPKHRQQSCLVSATDQTPSWQMLLVRLLCTYRCHPAHTHPPYRQRGPLSISIETHTHTHHCPPPPHQLHSTQWCAAALQWHSAALLKGFGETQFSNHKVFVAHLNVHTLSFYANWCAHWEAQLQWEMRHSPFGLPTTHEKEMERKADMKKTTSEWVKLRKKSHHALTLSNLKKGKLVYNVGYYDIKAGLDQWRWNKGEKRGTKTSSVKD